MAPGIAAITVKNGVNYDAPDGQDVKLCFIITAPKTFYWSVSWLSGTFFLKETATTILEELPQFMEENVEEKKGKH